MISALSLREKMVAQLICKGMSNHDIAQSMGLAVGTVKIHVHHILHKTNKRNRLERSTAACVAWATIAIGG
jgi:DNA-binding NarL/FixJ family response regulator